MVPPKLTSAFRDDDIELLRRARTDRDAVAYGRFVDLHLGRVFNQANRATGRYDEAAIVTEQAFGSVLSGPDEGLTPYVALGRRVLAESVAAPAEDRPTGEIAAIPEGLTSRGPVDEAAHQAVIIANSNLPAEQRLALVMRELDGANYQRIGQTLGRGRSSGAEHVGRARIALYSELDPRDVPPAWFTGDGRELLPSISAEMDGELDAAVRANVFQQIERSPGAREAQAALRNLREQYRAWPAATVPDGLRGRILADAERRGRIIGTADAPVAAGLSGADLAEDEAIRPRHFALLGGLAVAAILGGLVVGKLISSDTPVSKSLPGGAIAGAPDASKPGGRTTTATTRPQVRPTRPVVKTPKPTVKAPTPAVRVAPRAPAPRPTLTPRPSVSPPRAVAVTPRAPVRVTPRTVTPRTAPVQTRPTPPTPAPRVAPTPAPPIPGGGSAGSGGVAPPPPPELSQP